MWYQQTERPSVRRERGSGERERPVVLNSDNATTLFEGPVPVVVQREGKQSSTEMFMVGVMAGGSFPLVAVEQVTPQTSQAPPPASAAQVKRQVHIRVTSPSDPFLLYTASICEDDYSAFRESNGLRFDFVKLPSVLINLLEERTQPDTSTPRHTPLPDDLEDGVFSRTCRLSIATDTTGRFAFCKSDKYRDSEVLGFHVIHESDKGQKQYLAARAAKLDRDLSAATAELEATRRLLQERTDALTDITGTLHRERESTEVKYSKALSDLEIVHERKEQETLRAHHAEVTSLKERFEREMKDVRQTLGEQISGLQEELRTKTNLSQKLDTDLQSTVLTNKDLSSRTTNIAKDLELAQKRVETLQAQLEASEGSLRENHKELQQKMLRVVELEEKVRSLTELLAVEKQRGKGCETGLEAAKQEAVSWKSQAETNAAALEERTNELKKAHHIIRTMHAKLKESKQRREMVVEELADRVKEVEQTRGEAGRDRDELHKAKKEALDAQKEAQELRGRCEELKEKLDEANACIDHHTKTHRFSSSVYGAAGGVTRHVNTTAGSLPGSVRMPPMVPRASPVNTRPALPEPLPSPTISPTPPKDEASQPVGLSHIPHILTASPQRAPGLVTSLARSHPTEKLETHAAHRPSNFFVTDITGPVGSTA